jgi:HlyD family secretion protein
MDSTIAVEAPRQVSKARRKPRRWGRLILFAVGVAVVSGVGVWYWQQGQPAPASSAITTTVTTGDMEITIESGGAVEALRSGTVPFQQAGQVAEVQVAAGDIITKGQLLARVENQELVLAVERAEAELMAAEAKLAELQAGNRPEEITSAQASLDSARAQLTAAQQGADSADVAAAQANLAAARAELDALYEGPTGSELIETEVAMKNAEAAVRQAQAAYDQIKDRPEVAASQEALTLQEATHAYEAAQAKYDALLQGPTASEIAGAEAKVRDAEATLSDVRSPTSAADLAQAEAEVRRAQAELSLTTAGNRAEVITAQEAAVRGAEIALEEAQLAVAQSEVRAPYDGIVAEVTSSEGSFVSAGDEALTLMDISQLVLELSVNEIDLPQLEVGQSVNLTFEALPTTVLTGTVTAIAPVGTEDQGLVYYPVHVAFDAGDSDVKVGMTANASVIVEQLIGVLQVPTGALQGSGPLRTLEILYGVAKTPVTIAVEIGATNGIMTEIVRCLDTGDLCLQAGDVVNLETVVDEGMAGGNGDNFTFSSGAVPAGGGPIMIERRVP